MELLDSASHKLRLARYHGDTLIAILRQEPPDDLEDDLRVGLEAHLEGLAYTGTAAAEKTIRSVSPELIPEQGSIQNMILAATRADLAPEAAAFVQEFSAWWVGRGRRTRYAQAARDLRNDAAHTFYGKTQRGPRWRMTIRGGRGPIDLTSFAEGYLEELDALAELVARAEQLAAQAAQ